MEQPTRVPRRRFVAVHSSDLMTPPQNQSLSLEIKQVLNERNLLTANSRKKVCDLLENLSPCERSEVERRRSFRHHAVREILTSEQSYIRQLEKLMQFFVNPLKDEKIISSVTHTSLFGQIEMIYNLNGELLKQLEDDLDNVAYAFLKLAPFFKLYSVYAFDYKNAMLILQELVAKDANFRKFLYNAESRPEVQAKLNSLLIVPIQRVPRYKLLLQQVLLYTSPSDPDFKILKQSVQQIDNTASHINAVVEDQENTLVLLNLQNSLVNRAPNIVRPSRKIIKQGILRRVSSNGTRLRRYCVLMSDIFMYCKVLKERTPNTIVENSLEGCCIFPLKKCKVTEMFPGNFKIVCQGDGVILCADDQRDGCSWVTVVKEAIDLHIQCRKTLRKESSKRLPIRKKAVRSFGMENVLSPTKRKYEYENVFHCNNNVDSDPEENIGCFNLRKRYRGAGRTILPAPPINKAVDVPAPTIAVPPVSVDVKDATYGCVNPRNRKYGQQYPMQYGSGYRDVLYPLREVSGSEKSDNSPLAEFTKPNEAIADTETNEENQYEGVLTKRTLQFNDSRDSTLSLRQKISDFFAKLF